MARIFLTGGTGFLGGRVVERLARSGHSVTALVRGGRNGQVGAARPLDGDLLEPGTYTAALEGHELVLHLAAATGKAPPAEHFRTNVEGTRQLIDRARTAGVRRFMLVSSIAVKFPDISRYPYAQSKARAEALVRESGLESTVIRPTIIAGPGSPVLNGLARLAGLPVIPVFGPGQAKVQPILVDDLADLLVDAVNQDRPRDDLLELGGPDVVTVERLLEAIHRELRGAAARLVHLPLGPVLPMLSALERVAYGALPVTVGQLSTFRFDGTAAPNALFERRRSRLTSLADMVRLTFAR